MEKLRIFMKWYCYITVGVLIVCAIIISLSGEEIIPAITLWQILLSSFLTTAATVLFSAGKAMSASVFRYVLHYLILCVIMVLCGKWFGWMSFDIGGILMMVLAVAFVYGLTLGIYYLIDLRYAKQINRRLEELYREEK